MGVIGLISLSTSSYAQQQLHFSQLTNSFTNCIHKDSDGFIWVGTQDGILRYADFDFDVYRYQSDNPYSLPNNYVQDIVEDRNHDLWIGTFGGDLIQWDRTMERFYSYSLGTDAESIHSLELYNDSLLLVGSEEGLIRFNINSHTPIGLVAGEDPNDNFINDIYVSSEDEILLGTNGGLLSLSLSADAISPLLKRDNLIVYCVDGQAHRIYIGTNQGLYIYNRRKGTFENQLAEESVSTILLTDTNEWYLGTNAGIAHYVEGEGYRWYAVNTDSQVGLQSDLIHDFSNIDKEIIWVGTRKGVHQFTIDPPHFKTLQKEYQLSTCSSTTLGMTEDKNRDIWICSRDGLMHFTVTSDLSNWASYCHKPSNTPGMQDGYTINITSDKEDNLWLAYRNNGFSKISEEGGEWVWTNYPKATQQLSGDGVNQVFQDMEGRYWLASRGKGLIKFNPEDQLLTFYNEEYGLSHPYIFRINQHTPGYLWISTANGGLCRFDIDQESFDCKGLDHKRPESLSANMVLSTNIHSDDRLLVCTTEGLNILQPDGNFKKYTTYDGLPNNVIYAALEDDNGAIWLSTNEGISKINLTDEVAHFTNFNKTHGLASFEFNQHSFLEHSSGLFLFGGVEGVTVFDPLDIESHNVKPSLALTDFQLFNHSVPIGSDRSSGFFLDRSINKTEAIHLDYDENFIGFEYAALGIINAENTKYQYMLEGLESEWVDANQRSYAPYPKVPSGDYTFKVRLVDLNNNVVAAEKAVAIHIATPPWQTWWACMIYLDLFITSLFLITRVQKARTLAIARARENERDVFRKKLARDFHDEAGNKITRISLMTDTLTRKSKNVELIKSLNKLQDNIQDLRLGMTDFIWVLDPGKDSLSEALHRFMDFANETFEYSDIQFKMDPISPELKDIDMPSNVRRHFILIMKEATTNIMKHSDASIVVFNYRHDGKYWRFTIHDNGKGFDQEELKRINGLTNMTTRANKINGHLDIESTPGEGSKITLRVQLS